MKRTKERDRESEKIQQPDKAEVICPLIFKLTGLAVNYDLAWQPETKITVEDNEEFVVEEVTGCWKSNPVQRGHTEAFQRELKRLKEAGEVSWNEQAYYFTNSEGVAARKAYEKEVLEGRIKAHITSWGPNPKKANDKSRFYKFTGVIFEELKEKYPELYSRPVTTPEPAAVDELVDNFKEAITTSLETETKEAVEKETTPSRSELKEIEEEERVAAATSVEDVIEDPSIDETDDHNTIVLYVSEDMISERIDIKNESITWKTSDHEDMSAYLMELPEIGTEMWLSPGRWVINGQPYEVRIQD